MLQRSEITACLAGIAVLACACTALRAEQQPPARADEPLSAEIRCVRDLYAPGAPLFVRFLIWNSSDQAIEIPLETPVQPAAATTLPIEIVAGTPQQPALTMIYQDEQPAPLKPTPRPEASATVHSVFVEPHAVIGAEVDLGTLSHQLRYSGAYRVEWRPLGGRLGTAATTFRVESRKDAILVTDYGRVTFSLAYETAPRNVENFLELARTNFYDRKTLHRIIPNYLIQGGDPKGDGTGTRPDGKLVPGEFTEAPVDVGTLLMAHKRDDPNSASCQFFVALSRLPELDGRYTIIGQATDEESRRTLRKISELPTDRRDHPLRSVVITTFSLIDAEAAGPSPSRPAPASQPVVTPAVSSEAPVRP